MKVIKMMIEHSGFNSQIYGPVQVRDLSESLGEAGIANPTDSLKRHGYMDQRATPSQYPNALAHVPESTISNLERKAITATWLWVRHFSEGSTPSSAPPEHSRCSYGKHTSAEWLNTATLKSNCGPFDYNNGSWQLRR